ncbi:MAG: glucose-6-phosphate isomerase [Eggerthellaceae bacterium]|nr:glucose-6-phosphate isomerase [Eggerthellaceae bacterium]
MLSCENTKATISYPSARMLVQNKVASRIAAQDASLYDFTEEARHIAENFMGWANLASSPHVQPHEIIEVVHQLRNEGFKHMLLIGEGGSTQAPMTITKYNKPDENLFDIKVLDSVSPTRIRTITSSINIEKTVIVVSSKSGSTIEMHANLEVISHILETYVPREHMYNQFIAITDPDTPLHKLACEQNWRACFLGQKNVGGRFSALSVVGLVPAAFAGIDIDTFLSRGKEAELTCKKNMLDNPAIVLASFLYDNYKNNRGAFSFLTPKRGRVFGLWIEQLVAESLGKNGVGILPNIETDTLLFMENTNDRTVISYTTKADTWDERVNFQHALSYIHKNVPSMHYRIQSVMELAEHFVMWEYATAMLGWLMHICPFDQPDVASAKEACSLLLKDGLQEPSFKESFIGSFDMGEALVTTSPAIAGTSLHDVLYALLSSIQPGDYFSLNAFVPFDGEGRREALERCRHLVADSLLVPACLEIGPRYLHSTGQMQKGGPDTGVFLLISADEFRDIPVQYNDVVSLGRLAHAQAMADTSILSQRGKRCVHIHLPNHAGVTLRALSDAFNAIITEIKTGTMTDFWK